MQYLLTEDEYKALGGSEENEAYKRLLLESQKMKEQISNLLIKSDIIAEKNMHRFGEVDINIRISAVDAPEFLIELLKRRGEM